MWKNVDRHRTTSGILAERGKTTPIQLMSDSNASLAI